MPSTVVAHMQYDPATEILRITFVSGMVYDYKNVPQHVFASLKTSGSKGTYLNRHIKNHYRYEKVK